MTIIVTGGREFKNYRLLARTLDVLRPSLVVHGGCRGADSLAAAWAMSNKVEHKPYVVTDEEWKQKGKAAGPLRNRMMLEDHPKALVVAFPGNRGTADCVRTALELGHVVFQVRYENE